jgi:hypothetical protein
VGTVFSAAAFFWPTACVNRSASSAITNTATAANSHIPLRLFFQKLSSGKCSMIGVSLIT